MYLENLFYFATVALHPDQAPLHYRQQMVSIDLNQLTHPQPAQAAKVAGPGRLKPGPVNREHRQGLFREAPCRPEPHLILPGQIFVLIGAQQG